MKSRKMSIIMLAVILLLTAVAVLPRIIEAGRSAASAPEKSTSDTSGVRTRSTQGKKDDVTVGASIHNDTSPPLRDMKQEKVARKAEKEANENPKVPATLKHKDSSDAAVQGASLMSLFAPSMPATSLNFDGVAFPGVACNCAPPDTNGEVGATQYVQIVNEGYQVFNKATGASQLGPAGITTLWSGFGGVCQSNGSGDPVVLYDQLANRWVISQFAGVNVPTDECIAVSTTSDATGSYNRYDFHLGSNFFDYPHVSVWPDAYYMSMNVFNSAGTAFLGPQPFAFDRSKMLAGLPATFITTGVTGGSNEDVYLPSDLDGSILPPAGAPATFVEFPSAGAYRLFHFHVDFATPALSSFTLFASQPAAGFSLLCATTRSCVPQSGTTNKVDGIGDRLMFRLAYRNFGDHEALVGNYSVSSGGVAGIRWFELRNVTAGPVTLFQESTYQPDTTWRWMGSAAMDQQGNLAIGYSASSASIHPEIRYSGRLFTDPVNTLTQAESTLFAGAGSQTGTLNRWGDYSDLTVDPVDDCTFWYTQEYIPSNGSFNWRTRIGAFKFPGCGGSPTPTPTPTPSPTGTPTPTPTPSPTPTPAPAAPGNLTATAVSTSQINLAWTDNSNNEDGFKIERCQGSGCTSFVEIAQVGPNVSSFSNIGLARNTRYRYRVRAFNGGGNSAYSNIVAVRTLR
ncbi:MAG: fibronectin type III domain-containing protein [Pyrinomonadaceae bacterium]